MHRECVNAEDDDDGLEKSKSIVFRTSSHVRDSCQSETVVYNACNRLRIAGT